MPSLLNYLLAMRLALSAALAALLMVSSPARAATPVEVRASTVEFYMWCTSDDADRQFLCRSYLLGVIDAFATVNGLHDFDVVMVCPNGTVDTEQALGTILPWIKRNLSAVGGKPAPLGISLALLDAQGFACAPTS